jgi:replicative DNA helicase
MARVHGDDMGTGGAFLHSLIRRAGDIGYHAPRIRAEAVRRDMQAALLSCEQITRAADWDPETALEAIRKRIDDAGSTLADRKVLRPQSETVYEVLDALENQEDPGLPTGYADLDEAIGGLRPGELIVTGARPGVGKTLIGLGIADYVGTRLGLPVLFSSLEMREEELTHRRIAAAAKVPLHSIVRHQLAEGDWGRIARAQDRITGTRLYIDDTPAIGPAHIRNQLRALARSGNEARLLVIDYLGYMAAPKAESRQQAVAELARQSKNIAREFAIPVVLLAQLNRGPETRHDKRPAPADLRESGEIEQSADIILLLHREDAYERESPRAGEIDVIIAKNRQGPLCTITMCFQGHFGRIVGMSREDIPEGEWTASTVIGRAA